MRKILVIISCVLFGSCTASGTRDSVASDAGRVCSDSIECIGVCLPPDTAYSKIEAAKEDPKFPGVIIQGSRRKLLAAPGDQMSGVCSLDRDKIKPTCGTFIVKGHLVSTGPCEALGKSYNPGT